ncbi:MAG: hypothetical protein R3185_08350, partial [Candidatus Thermoplasmatota archaeon]|nr:hypothetical protein [Candidatus Thermoplasmatota archaeon]
QTFELDLAEVSCEKAPDVPTGDAGDGPGPEGGESQEQPAPLPGLLALGAILALAAFLRRES